MMKNYIQQIIELFGHNEYSLATRRKVQRWLADDNHACLLYTSPSPRDRG